MMGGLQHPISSYRYGLPPARVAVRACMSRYVVLCIEVRLPTAPELSRGPDGPTWVSSYPCLDLVNQEVVYAFAVDTDRLWYPSSCHDPRPVDPGRTPALRISKIRSHS